MGHNNATYKVNFLTVRLGDTLKFVLLLDGVAVAGATSGVDELISQTLSNRLDVTEGSLSGAGAQKPDSLVHTSQRRHINGLTPDGTLTTNTGRILTGSGVDDSVDDNLKRKKILIVVKILIETKLFFNIKGRKNTRICYTVP